MTIITTVMCNRMVEMIITILIGLHRMKKGLNYKYMNYY